MPAIGTLSYTEADMFTALRTALVAMFDIEVVKVISNRVPQPQGDYILMTPILTNRLSTNYSTYTEDTRTESHDSEYVIQLDFYGTTSGNFCNLFEILFRSDYLFQYGLVPHYAGTPRQLSFVNAEKQMQERWLIDIHLSYRPEITLAQQTANELSVNQIVNVVNECRALILDCKQAALFPIEIKNQLQTATTKPTKAFYCGRAKSLF